jgi:hypothetical protein
MEGEVMKDLAILFTLALGLFASSPRAHACSCTNPPPPIRSEYRQAHGVFIGKPIARETIYKRWQGRLWPAYYAYTFRVERPYKGQLAQNVRVLTATDDGRCGIRFQMNRRYLVWAGKSPWTGKAQFHAQLCSRTDLANRSKREIEWLERNTQPSSRDSDQLLDVGTK